MRNRSILFLLCFVSLVAGIVSSSISQADPITAREAAEWEAHVRRLMKWDSSVDLKVEAAERRAEAEKNLAVNPQSRSDRRDLADALHTLGHMSEHDHRFEFAIAFHMKALENYLVSGLETRESWNDGTEHAREHLFMDLYDEGVLLERKGDFQNANRYFDSAAYFAHRSGIANNLRHKTDRFDSRFEPLQIRLKQMAHSSGATRFEIGTHFGGVFQEVQCKVLFGNP